MFAHLLSLHFTPSQTDQIGLCMANYSPIADVDSQFATHLEAYNNPTDTDTELRRYLNGLFVLLTVNIGVTLVQNPSELGSGVTSWSNYWCSSVCSST